MNVALPGLRSPSSSTSPPAATAWGSKGTQALAVVLAELSQTDWPAV